MTALYHKGVSNLIKRNFGVLTVLCLWVLSIAGRIWADGLSFGLDYGIYQPDGSHYAYRTLVFLGEDSLSAATQVSEWYKTHGIKNNIFEPEFLTPANVSSWGLVAPRILYSILSVPFVAIFGIPGTLVIPFLSFLALLLTSFYFGRKFVSVWFGLLLSFSLSVSPSVLRWMLSNLTDSLLCGLFSLVAYLLARDVVSNRADLGIIVLVFLTSMTRFSIPIWVALSFVLLFQGRKYFALLVSISSFIAFIPALLWAPSNALSPQVKDGGLIERLISFVVSIFKIGFIEVAQLAILDRILLFLLLSAIVLAILYRREESSHFFIMVLVAVWSIGAINGTIGVNFRYQLPLLPFMTWVISASLGKLRNRAFRNTLHIIGGKTQD
jgi:hypothetical protein